MKRTKERKGIQGIDIKMWKFKRTPALGKNTLTVLEALADSARVLLQNKKYDLVENRINRMLKILRKEIELEKKRKLSGELIKRCEYRENSRTRCNRAPAEYYAGVGYRCKLHKPDKKEIDKQKSLLDYMETSDA